MKGIASVLLFFSIIILAACTQTPDYPIEPVITYKGASKRIINQGSPTAPPDTLQFSFTFTDGDGDLKDGTILLQDSRDTSIQVDGIFTKVPDEENTNGLSGEIIVTLESKDPADKLCCIIDYGDFQLNCVVDPRFPQDTFSYLIRMKDRAGHWSNTIRTETFTILCR